jgi:hypothetical protein
VNFNRANVPTTAGNVYNFRISARDLANKSDSHPYLTAQASLSSPVFTAAAPTLAKPTVSANGQVNLNWNAVTPPTGTTISYIVNVNGTSVNTNLLSYNYLPMLSQLPATLTFSVQAVATAIRVSNPTMYGSTTGPASNVQTITVPAAADVPSGLAATITPTGAVRLNWTAVAPVAGTTISYVVSVNGGTPVAMARGAALVLATGASYQVQVASVAIATGISTQSQLSSAITVDLTAAAVPNAPATATLNAAGTTLTWTAPAALTGTTGSTNVTYTYNVQQSVDGGVNWTTLTATPITARTLAVTTPVGANYQFQVAAQATRYGLPTSAAGKWTTTAVLNRAPAASTAPTAALTGPRNLSISWTNASTNITGFTIQRRLGRGAWTTIAPAPTVTQTGNVYSIVDVVTAAGSYTYRVTATSLGGTTAQATSNAIVTP